MLLHLRSSQTRFLNHLLLHNRTLHQNSPSSLPRLPLTYPRSQTQSPSTTPTTPINYPSNANAESTSTATPQAVVVTNNIVLTLTIGSSTILYTEPAGVQTETLTSSSSYSSSANTNSASSISNPKTNIAAIVGGIVGALVLIAILFAVVFIWLPRRQKKKERNEKPTLWY